jgi:hypothetical protein
MLAVQWHGLQRHHPIFDQVKDPSEDYQPWSSQRDVDKLEEDLKSTFILVNLTLPLTLLPSYPNLLTLTL